METVRNRSLRVHQSRSLEPALPWQLCTSWWLLRCSASIGQSQQKARGPKHQYLHRLAFDGRSCQRMAWVLAHQPVSAGGEPCSFLSPRLGSQSASSGYFKFLKSLLSLNSRSQVMLVTRVPDKYQNKNAHRGEDPSWGASPRCFSKSVHICVTASLKE